MRLKSGLIVKVDSFSCQDERECERRQWDGIRLPGPFRRLRQSNFGIVWPAPKTIHSVRLFFFAREHIGWTDFQDTMLTIKDESGSPCVEDEHRGTECKCCHLMRHCCSHHCCCFKGKR